MKVFRVFLVALLFAVLCQASYAATVYGNVYDLSLSKVPAKVHINTTPEQFLVSKDGSYSFDAPPGFYEITAEAENGAESRNLSVAQDGRYVIDLILFPDLEEGGIAEDIGISILDEDRRILIPVIILIFVIITGIILFIILRKNKGKKEDKGSQKKGDENGDADSVLEIIKKEGGRATQKEVRKQIPLSEAKISLMIAELEHKGKIEKIKKGRGNIIVLKR